MSAIVLILIVVEDGLVPKRVSLTSSKTEVLILIVVEDGLVPQGGILRVADVES